MPFFLKVLLFYLLANGQASLASTSLAQKTSSCGNALSHQTESQYKDPNSGGHGSVRKEGEMAVKSAITPETQKFLIREATVLRLLSKEDTPDSIPRFIAFNNFDRAAELKTQWIEGETLLSAMTNSDINRNNFKKHSKIFHSQMKQLLSTLSWLHKRKYLHLDIKPQNIMIEPNGNLKLIDFGAAVKTNGSPLINSPISYTEGSAAPELLSHFQGQETFDRTLSASTDLYSVGSVFNFWASTVDDFVNNPSPELKNYLNEMRSRIIQPLLMKEPSQRPNIEEILTQLDALETKYLNN